MLETVVFGKRAGEQAAELVKGDAGTVAGTALSETLAEQSRVIEEIKARAAGERQGIIRREMKAVMTDKVGVYREEKPLAEAADDLAELKERYRSVILDNKSETFNYDLVDALELGAMLELAEVTAITALKRTECRGSHWRIDHPGRNDDEWLKHSMTTYNPDGAPHVEYTDVIITKYEPMERKY